MDKIKALWQLAKRFENLIKYAIIGVSGICLDFAVFYLLYKKMGVYYQFANFISVSCGITNNFLLNAFFNFKRKDKLLTRFIKFYSVGIGGLLANSILLYIFIEMLKCDVMITKLIAGLAVAANQYVLNRAFSFRR